MKTFVDFLLEATMTTSDALKTLGLSSNFTPDQLKAAYKRMAIANHPDKGGSVIAMQQINLARDVLANPAANQSSKSNDYDDYDDEDDRYPPHPQSTTIRSMQVFQMFRSELNADVRARTGDGVIRVPLMQNGQQARINEVPIIIEIMRQTNMIGTEYRVRGLFKLVSGGGTKPLVKFNNDNDDMVFWESKRSVEWMIKELQALDKLTTKNLQEIATQIQNRLKYYQKNQTKIDPNIR